MKKTYSMPEFVAIELEEKDIITLSDGNVNDDLGGDAGKDPYAPEEE